MVMMISNDKISAGDFEPVPMNRDDMDKAAALTIQIVLLLGAALISISRRLYVRCRQSGAKNLGLDDGLAVAGAILFVPNLILAYLMNIQTDQMGKHALMIDPSGAQSGVEYHLRVLGSKLHPYGWLCYSAALWMFKAAFLATVLRRTAELARRTAYRSLGFGFLAVTWLATTMAYFQNCRPLSHMRQLHTGSGQYCQPATSLVLVWVYLGFDVITNLYLAFAAAKEGKPTMGRLQWLAMLMCGLLATGAAVARAAILSSGHEHDAEKNAEAWAIWQIFIFVAAVGFMDVPYPPHPDDDTRLHGLLSPSRFSTKQLSPAKSEATILGSPELTESYDKIAESSVEEIMVEGRRNSGIERKVEVSVFQESFIISPEGPCNICGNYTKSWAHDEDANKPEQRSSYFGGNVHFHVPNYGVIYRELHESAL